MRTISIVLLSLVLLVMTIAIAATFLPNTISYNFSKTIHAPATVPFSMVNSLQRWPDWAPNAITLQQTNIGNDGPPSGTGNSILFDVSQTNASYREITESTPYSVIRTKTVYKDEGYSSSTHWQFYQEGDSTTIFLSYTSTFEMGLIERLISILVAPNPTPEYENALTELKALSEQSNHHDLLDLYIRGYHKFDEVFRWHTSEQWNDKRDPMNWSLSAAAESIVRSERSFYNSLNSLNIAPGEARDTARFSIALPDTFSLPIADYSRKEIQYLRPENAIRAFHRYRLRSILLLMQDQRDFNSMLFSHPSGHQLLAQHWILYHEKRLERQLSWIISQL